MGKNLKGKELGRGFSQRKDGRYEARAVVRGKKIDIYHADLIQLKREFEELKTRLLCDERDEYVDKSLAFWVKEWFDKYKSQQLKTESSRIIYYRKIKNTFVNQFGEKNIQDITNANVQVACNVLSQKGYTDRTIKEALAILKECLDVAMSNRLIQFNPCVGVYVKPVRQSKERRALTHEEQAIFLKENEGRYYEYLYKFMLSTGLRIGEIGALRWSDIDFVRKEINVNRSLSVQYLNGKKYVEINTPKTALSVRSVPFFSDTEEILKAWKQVRDSMIRNKEKLKKLTDEFGDLVFITQAVSPITRYSLARDINTIVDGINLRALQSANIALRSAGEKCNVALKGSGESASQEFEHIHPHTFRHTFITRCFEKGLDPVFIQRIAGHSSYATTLMYTHVLDQVTEREVSKAGSFLEMS